MGIRSADCGIRNGYLSRSFACFAGKNFPQSRKDAEKGRRIDVLFLTHGIRVIGV